MQQKDALLKEMHNEEECYQKLRLENAGRGCLKKICLIW